MANSGQTPGCWAVEKAKVIRAREAAVELRAMFNKLSPIEKLMAVKQIEAVRRLVEAVEAL